VTLENKRKMRVLVTGSTGFIGSAIVSELNARGHSVVAYSRSEKPSPGPGKTERIKGDVFDTARLLEAMKQCDTVIHAVGLAGVRLARERPDESFQDNVRSLQVVLEALRNTGVRKLLLPSSSSVYGTVDKLPIAEDMPPNPTNIYGFHKYMAEKLAEAYSGNYGIQLTILRLFNVYDAGKSGILSTLAEKALRNEVVQLYGEKQKRDFIHLSDIADAFVKMLELKHKFEIYNVGTGIARSIEDIVNLAKECFPALRVEFGAGSEVLYDSVADVTKIQNAIAFNPDKSADRLKEAMREMVEYGHFQQGGQGITA
jgi:UDP-glucose 4-epimerase